MINYKISHPARSHRFLPSPTYMHWSVSIGPFGVPWQSNHEYFIASFDIKTDSCSPPSSSKRAPNTHSLIHSFLLWTICHVFTFIRAHAHPALLIDGSALSRVELKAWPKRAILKCSRPEMSQIYGLNCDPEPKLFESVKSDGCIRLFQNSRYQNEKWKLG